MGDNGTGVAAYGAALREAISSLGSAPLLLSDDSVGRFGVRDSRARRYWRAISARLSPVRSLQPRTTSSAIELYRTDVFRLARYTFKRTGRLLHLRSPIGPGIMHWTYPVPIVLNGWANIYTVHDAIPLITPSLSVVSKEDYQGVMVAISQVASRIITVSNSARNALIRSVQIEPDLVEDLGSAVTSLDPHEDLPVELSPGKYLLFYGTIERRKNVLRIIEAWQAARVPLALVLAGPPGDAYHDVMTRYGNVPNLHLMPWQQRPALMRLLVDAKALVFPSLAEGFGLPVIEAMAVGTPVITSREEQLVEVAGGAALLVNPRDTAAISAAIVRLCTDRALAARLVHGGQVRARDFSVAAFGRRLAGLYTRITAEQQSVGFSAVSVRE